ncbi:23S rRNA (uracil(1939)-C(5))-methyltransferase RlmD [Anoxybacterium hadale]|uniref:23S rRNA (Uracil(1939)-C(5))-methyltransferase RlmD n=1 Tax=Anoxybacterium hadale TaxID=3408580 RepID=A0ACD1AH60_9FIRM|nr:23S rRNA (uracil(1939)-C(5))-methyltransferase RlmD [Clostridiales bacterium]
MIEQGKEYEITIEDMSHEGQGIGRIEGLAVFVDGAVVGDVVKAELTKLKKSYAFGRLTEILTPSEYRVSAACEYFGSCGGCSLQSMSYEGQLKLKQKLVKDKLTRIGGLENPLVRDTIGMDVPENYRNKAQFPVGMRQRGTQLGNISGKQTGKYTEKHAGKHVGKNLAKGMTGEAAVGFYQAKSHQIINCETCMIQSAPAEKIAQALREYMKSDHIPAYDEKTGKGLIRHLIVKTAFGTGEVMAILVINGKGMPNGEKLVLMMDDAINELPPDPQTGIEYSLESVVLNINKKNTSEIMGSECVTLAGKPNILEEAGGLSFEISPMSFYQINPVQMVKLYDKALEYAALTGAETVLDLYCGVGTIGLYCASKAKKVIGIESVKAAVLDANRNAVINGIVNAEYICGKAEEELPRLLKEGVQADVVILDPPRAGCDPALLDAVAQVCPKRIVYVSCDPATLARDVKILGELGYGFVEAQPVDMFPHTGHVETVIKMRKCGLGEER